MIFSDSQNNHTQQVQPRETLNFCWSFIIGLMEGGGEKRSESELFPICGHPKGPLTAHVDECLQRHRAVLNGMLLSCPPCTRHLKIHHSSPLSFPFFSTPSRHLVF